MDKQREIKHKVGCLKSSIMGALDGLQFDNTCDVIERSVVLSQLEEELKMVEELEKILNERNSVDEG